MTFTLERPVVDSKEDGGFVLEESPIAEKKNLQVDDGFQLESIVKQPYIAPQESTGFKLEKPEPGFFVKSYQKTLKPLLDWFSENEVGSDKLIPIEDFEKPKPTDNNHIATLQLLTRTPDIVREEAIEEISKLIQEGKLFSEEAIKRLPIDPEISRKILIEGLGEGKQFKRDISFSQAIKEGEQESAFGIITGRGVKDYETLLNRAESEIPFLKRQAKNLSKIIGDIPAFVTGGAVASLPAGGPETPVGAILATTGAFATQAMIESAYNEALRLVSENPELSGKTLGQLSELVTDPEALKTIGLATLESGAIGALVAINPIMKGLEKTPLSKLFKYPVVKSASKLASEVTTLSTAPAILQGKIPTAEDFLDNAVLLGGLKASGTVISKVAKYAHREKMVSEDITKKIGEHITEKDLKDLESARTIEDVDAILKDIKERESDKEKKPDAKSEVLEPEKEVKKAKSELKPDTPEQSKELTQREGLAQPEQAERLLEIGTEKDVPKKSEIIQVFKNTFKDTPIRIGKFAAATKKGTRGFFKLNENVIRVKEAGMIETSAHELGHKLHMAMFGGEGSLKTQLQNINEALKPFMGELEPISRYKPHDLEGFAEFTRMYVTNPEAAKELAPKFYEFFEKDLGEKAPSVKEALLQAREMFERYIKADAVARTYAHIHSSFDRTLWDKTGDVLKKHFNLDKIKTEWLNESFPIKRAVADTLGIAPSQVENWVSPLNPYIAARVLKGWAGKAEVMIFHETFDYKTLKLNGKSFEEVMEPIKTIGDRQELSAYLVAKRSALLRKRGIASGLDKRTEAETIRRLSEKNDPIAKELNDYQNRVLEYYRDSGMISNESFNKMKAVNGFYVPFYRFFEEGEKSIASKSGKDTGKLQAKNMIKRIFGSQREIIDPLESIINNTFAMTQQAEKNGFGQKMSALSSLNPRGGKYMERLPPKMAKVYEITKAEIIDAMVKEATRHPEKAEKIGADEILLEAVVQMIPESIDKWRPGAWSPAENVVTVFRDGKPTYYETTTEIAELFKRGGSSVEAGIITKVLALPAKVLRAGAILNPRFIQKNAIRDLVGGMVYTKHGGRPLIDDIYKPLTGLMSSIKKDALYVDWLKAGGGMSTMQSIDKSVLSIKKGLGKGLDKVRPIAFLRRLGEISEEMNRLAEYSKAVEAMGTDRWQKEIAAFQSRDVSIDFAKTGLQTKALNQIIPFWNATIQGVDKLARTIASKDPQVIQNFLTRATAGIVVPTLIMSAANYGDPDIDEIDEATKDTNWLFKDPITGEIWQIPVPFETGVLFHGLTRRLFNHIVKEDPHAFDGFFGSIVEAATPGFIPTAAQPFIEVWANKDFWRQQYIVHPSQKGLISEEQYSSYTSETAREIARAMSYMPGIDAYESSITSPAIVDHFIKTWTAGLGRLALNVSDKALNLIGIKSEIVKPEERLMKKLGLSAFIKDFPTARTKSVGKFYDIWEKWNKLNKSIKSKIDKVDIEGAKRLQTDLKNLAPLNMGTMAKAMQRNQALINNVYHNPKMSPKEKRDIINKLYLQQITMARGFLNVIDKKKLK